MRDRLEPPYRATRYEAGGVSLRVGEPSPGLDRLLDAAGVRAWAFVTAYNPGSVPLPDAENAARQARLEAELAAAGCRFLRGRGVGDAGDWPPEASVLVLGIDEPAALDLARRHGQAAVVVGERGGPARLAWA